MAHHIESGPCTELVTFNNKLVFACLTGSFIAQASIAIAYIIGPYLSAPLYSPEEFISAWQISCYVQITFTGLFFLNSLCASVSEENKAQCMGQAGLIFAIFLAIFPSIMLSVFHSPDLSEIGLTNYATAMLTIGLTASGVGTIYTISLCCDDY